MSKNTHPNLLLIRKGSAQVLVANVITLFYNMQQFFEIFFILSCRYRKVEELRSNNDNVNNDEN